jgi:kynurenine formamidase
MASLNSLLLVDLTRTLDPADVERLPAEVRPMASVLVPEIEYLPPDGEGRERFAANLGCDLDDLPGGEGWGEETIRELSTHLGTHVDAPLHYGSTCEGRPSRTITDIAVDELYCESFVLDLRGRVTPGQAISMTVLQEAVAALGVSISQGSAVLLRTGQEAFDIGDREYYSYPGMDRDGTLYLAGLGAKVLGTDAAGWDRPFPAMRAAFVESGDNRELWDGHRAGREKEVFIVQQLTNLDALPSHGFYTSFFPLKIARCSAAPARCVAFVPR